MLKLLDYLNGMLLNVAQRMIPARMECMHVLQQMIAVYRNQDSIVHNSDRAHHRAHQMEQFRCF
jgi:DNA-binding FrmR family transcriptional regulator